MVYLQPVLWKTEATAESEAMSNALAEFKQAAIANTLRRCALFADMAGNDLTSIASITTAKSVAKGAYLFWEGAPVHGFYVVQNGAIKVHRLNLKGQEQVFHVFRPAESFAEETMLTDAGYPADASATEDSRVLLIQKSGFLGQLKANRELALRLLRSVSRQVRSLMGLVDDLTLKDVNTRLAHWLIQHCREPESHRPQRIELVMTKRLLASELGIASETLSRALARFRNHHLVRIEGSVVILICPMKLAAIVHSNLGLTLGREAAPDWNESGEESAANKLASAA
jgi:CRP-like cAMP-binding protein